MISVHFHFIFVNVPERVIVHMQLLNLFVHVCMKKKGTMKRFCKYHCIKTALMIQLLLKDSALGIILFLRVISTPCGFDACRQISLSQVLTGLKMRVTTFGLPFVL